MDVDKATLQQCKDGRHLCITVVSMPAHLDPTIVDPAAAHGLLRYETCTYCGCLFKTVEINGGKQFDRRWVFTPMATEDLWRGSE